jgi:cation transport regulator ChaB
MRSLFPEAEFQIGEVWITKKQLQKTIKRLFPQAVEEAKIHAKFNSDSGEIEHKYAWNAIYNDLNRTGRAAIVAKALTDVRE